MIHKWIAWHLDSVCEACLSAPRVWMKLCFISLDWTVCEQSESLELTAFFQKRSLLLQTEARRVEAGLWYDSCSGKTTSFTPNWENKVIWSNDIVKEDLWLFPAPYFYFWALQEVQWSFYRPSIHPLFETSLANFHSSQLSPDWLPKERSGQQVGET